MINKLLSNTEEATVTLQTQTRKFNITHLKKGEDITRAVSLLEGAIRHFAQIKRKKQGSDHDWYDEMTRHVLKIMQISSVDDFNDIFKRNSEDSFKFIQHSLVEKTYPLHPNFLMKTFPV